MTILLETVIARVESSDRPYAIRFEPTLWSTTPAWVSNARGVIAKANGCTNDTALAIACTSYGLFQILGSVLYGDLHFPNPVSYFHYDAEQQVTQFRKLVTMWGFEWEKFDFGDEALLTRYATRYNGPGPTIPGYVAKMKAAYEALSTNV